ncbi:MAG: hypothetical protein AAB515_02860 [Patescibacteria group bacterium]
MHRQFFSNWRFTPPVANLARVTTTVVPSLAPPGAIFLYISFQP